MVRAEDIPAAQPPAPDDWDAHAASFQQLGDALRRSCDRPAKEWTLWDHVLRVIRNDPLHRPILDELERFVEEHFFLSAVGAFPLFVRWWTLRSAMPAGMNHQDPSRVASWIGDLAGYVASLWTWYLDKSAHFPQTGAAADAFGPVAWKAREVVLTFTASALAPLPPTTSARGVGAYAAQRYLRDELLPFLLSATGQVTKTPPLTGSASRAASVAASSPGEARDPSLVSICYDPETSAKSCDINGKRSSDLPASVVTVLERARREALLWRGAEVAKLTAGGVPEPDVFEDVSRRGVPPGSMLVKAQGDTLSNFVTWWQERFGLSDPLPPARKRGKSGFRIVAWKVLFPSDG